MKASIRVFLFSGILLTLNGMVLTPVQATAFESGVDAYYAGNYEDALRHFRMAATRGHVRVGAQHNLGVMYDNGVGVPEDDATAVTWFRRAAEGGYIKSQSNLGLMYANGEGVPRDDVKAYLWFDVAGRRGNPVAARNRDTLARSMKPEQVETAQALASQCMKRRFRNCDR